GVAYRPDRPAVSIAGDATGEIALEGEGPGGLRLVKRLRFTGDSYLFDVNVQAQGDHVPDAIGLVVTPVAAQSASGGRTPGTEVAAALSNQKLVEHSVADLAKQPTMLDGSVWAGFSAQYFADLIVSERGPARVVMAT